MPTPDQTAQAVADAQAALAAAHAAHAAALEAVADPRPAHVIMVDLFTLMISRFGNHPDLEKLHQEFKAAVAKLS